MKSLLWPAVALMNRLSFGMKFSLISVLFLLPWGRRILRKRVLPILRRSGHGIADVARRALAAAR